MKHKSLIGEPIIALYAEGVSSNRDAENSPKDQKKHNPSHKVSLWSCYSVLIFLHLLIFVVIGAVNLLTLMPFDQFILYWSY